MATLTAAPPTWDELAADDRFQRLTGGERLGVLDQWHADVKQHLGTDYDEAAAQSYLDQQRAKIAAEGQSPISTAARSFMTGAGEVFTGTVEGLGGLATDVAQAADQLTGIPGVGAAAVRAVPMAQGLQAAAPFAEAAQQEIERTYAPDARLNPWSAMLGGAAGQAVAMLPSAVAGPAGPLTLGGAMGYGQGREQAAALGVTDPLGRMALGAGFAGTEVLTGRMGGLGAGPMTQAFSDVVQRVGGNTLKTIGSEAIEEPITGFAQDALSFGAGQLVQDPNRPGFTTTGVELAPLSPLSPQAFDRRVQELAGGAVGGTVFAGAARLAGAGAPKKGSGPPPLPLPEGEAGATEEDFDAFDQTRAPSSLITAEPGSSASVIEGVGGSTPPAGTNQNAVGGEQRTVPSIDNIGAQFRGPEMARAVPVIPDNPLGYRDSLDFLNEMPIAIGRSGTGGELDWQETASVPKYYRPFIASEEGLPIDVVAQAAYEAQLIPQPTADALMERVQRDIGERRQYRVQGRQQQQQALTQEKQALAFDKSQQKVKAKPGALELPVDLLAAGDELTIDGEPVTVRAVDADEDGYVTRVVLEDGKKFGVQAFNPQTREGVFVDEYQPRPQLAGEEGVFSRAAPQRGLGRGLAELMGKGAMAPQGAGSQEQDLPTAPQAAPAQLPTSTSTPVPLSRTLLDQAEAAANAVPGWQRGDLDKLFTRARNLLAKDGNVEVRPTDAVTVPEGLAKITAGEDAALVAAQWAQHRNDYVQGKTTAASPWTPGLTVPGKAAKPSAMASPDEAAQTNSASPGGLTEAEIDPMTGLPVNEDGTVTVYHGTTQAAAREIRGTSVLKSAGEPDIYFTSAKEGTGYGDGTVIAVRLKPDQLILDDEFPNGRKDFRVDVGNRRMLKVKLEPDFNPSAPALGAAAPAERLRTAYRQLDRSGQGYVRIPDLARAAGLTPEETRGVLAKMDDSGQAYLTPADEPRNIPEADRPFLVNGPSGKALFVTLVPEGTALASPSTRAVLKRNTAVNKAELTKLGLPTSTPRSVWGQKPVKEAMSRIAKDTRLPATVRRMAKLLQDADLTGLFLRVEADGRKKYTGLYQPLRNGQGELVINLRHLGVGNVDPALNMAETLVHEVLHHATYRALRGPKNDVQKSAIGNLEQLRRRVKAVLGSQQMAEFDYQTSNLDEFIAALFTQKPFQDALAGIPAEATPKTLVQQVRTLLDEAFRLLAEIVTGKKVPPGSVLDSAFQNALRLVEDGVRVAATEKVGAPLANTAQTTSSSAGLNEADILTAQIVALYRDDKWTVLKSGEYNHDREDFEPDRTVKTAEADRLIDQAKVFIQTKDPRFVRLWYQLWKLGERASWLKDYKENLLNVTLERAKTEGWNYGYRLDPNGPPNFKLIAYIDTPHGQVSFHLRTGNAGFVVRNPVVKSVDIRQFPGVMELIAKENEIIAAHPRIHSGSALRFWHSNRETAYKLRDAEKAVYESKRKEWKAEATALAERINDQYGTGLSANSISSARYSLAKDPSASVPVDAPDPVYQGKWNGDKGGSERALAALFNNEAAKVSPDGFQKQELPKASAIGGTWPTEGNTSPSAVNPDFNRAPPLANPSQAVPLKPEFGGAFPGYTPYKAGDMQAWAAEQAQRLGADGVAAAVDAGQFGPVEKPFVLGAALMTAERRVRAAKTQVERDVAQSKVNLLRERLNPQNSVAGQALAAQRDALAPMRDRVPSLAVDEAVEKAQKQTIDAAVPVQPTVDGLDGLTTQASTEATETLAGALGADEMDNETDSTPQEQAAGEAAQSDLEAEVQRLKQMQTAERNQFSRLTTKLQKILATLQATGRNKGAVIKGMKERLAARRAARANTVAANKLKSLSSPAQGITAPTLPDTALDDGLEVLLEQGIQIDDWKAAMTKRLGPKYASQLTDLYEQAVDLYQAELTAAHAEVEKRVKTKKAKKTPQQRKARAQTEEQKARKVADGILTKIAETHSDPPIWKRPTAENPIRKLYREHVKAMAELALKGDRGAPGWQAAQANEQATFAQGLQALKVPAGLANTLAQAANLEINARAENTRAEQALKLREELERLLKDSPALQRMINQLRNTITGGLNWKQIFTSTATAQRQWELDTYAQIRQHPKLQSLTADQARQMTRALSGAWQAQRRKIWKRELDKTLIAAGMAKPKHRAKIEASAPRLLALINLGALDAATFRDAVAKEFGLRSIHDAEVQKVKALAEDLQNTPEGVPYRRKAQAFIDGLQDLTKLTRTEILQSYWTAMVLSGWRTQVDIGLGLLNGLEDVGLSGLGRTLRTAKPRVAGEALLGFLGNMPQALGEAMHHVLTGDRSLMKNYDAQVLGALEDGQKTIGSSARALRQRGGWRTIPGWGMEGVARMMTALGHITTSSTYEGAKWLAIANHPDLYLKAQQISAADRAAVKQQARQVLTGGVEPVTMADKLAERRYIMELLDEKFGNPEVLGEAQTFANETALEGDPTGLGMLFMEAVNALTVTAPAIMIKKAEKENWNKTILWLLRAGAVWAKPLTGTKFARTVSHALNRNMTYVPGVGAVRFGMDAKWGTPKGDLVLAKQMVGLLFCAAFKMWWLGDDEEDKKQGKPQQRGIEGGWENLTAEQKAQNYAAGKKPWHLWELDKNGKIRTVNYQNWGISSLMAALGQMQDRERYQGVTDHTSLIMSGIWTGMFAWMDKAQLQGLQILTGRDSPYSTSEPELASLKNVNKFAATLVGGAFPRLGKDIDAMIDPSLRKTDEWWQVWARELPVARSLSSGKRHDIFGQDIKLDRGPLSRVYQEVTLPMEYKVLGALNERGVTLPDPSFHPRKVPMVNAPARDMTTLERDRYQRITTELYRAYIADPKPQPRYLKLPDGRFEQATLTNAQYLLKLPPDDAQEAISKATKTMRAQAVLQATKR